MRDCVQSPEHRARTKTSSVIVGPRQEQLQEAGPWTVSPLPAATGEVPLCRRIFADSSHKLGFVFRSLVGREGG